MNKFFIALLLGGVLAAAAGSELYWSQLEKDLEGPESSKAIKKITADWAKRPKEFVSKLDEHSLAEIIQLLSEKGSFEINLDEFSASDAARKILPRYLYCLSNNSIIATLPKSFRKEFYRQLKNTEEAEWLHRAVKVIPIEWIDLDGTELAEALSDTPYPLLGLLGDETLQAILNNRKNSCSVLTFEALKALKNTLDLKDSRGREMLGLSKKVQLEKLTPACMAAIRNLENMSLSSLMSTLPAESFSLYNGPLSDDTTRSLRNDHLAYYGDSIKGDKICQRLRLNILPCSTVKDVSARCLIGYLSGPNNPSLGNLLECIPWKTLTKARSVLGAIPIGDIARFSFHFTCKILQFSEVYTKLDITKMPLDLIQALEAPTIYYILGRVKEPVKIKSERTWLSISDRVVKGFTESMMGTIKKFHVENFEFMPKEMLQTIIDSDTALANLPQPVNLITINPGSSQNLKLTKERFSALARVAPNFAGQLLLSVKVLPSDLLSTCDGNLLRTLVLIVPNKTPLDWAALFKTFWRERPKDANVIRQMSIETALHICATITGFKDYKSLGWLRQNMTGTCQEALSFNTNDPSILPFVPELFPKDGPIPWLEMLKYYSIDDWSDPELTGYIPDQIGELCDFWDEINSKHKEIVEIMNPRLLGLIHPRCVRGLNDVLKQYPKIIQHLGIRSFSLYTVGQLPCRLQQLSCDQIENLSNFLRAKQGSQFAPEDCPRHVLAGVTLDELNALTIGQAYSISGWECMPDSIRSKALELQFEKACKNLESLLARRDDPESKESDKINVGDTILNAVDIDDAADAALSWCKLMAKAKGLDSSKECAHYQSIFPSDTNGT